MCLCVGCFGGLLVALVKCWLFWRSDDYFGGVLIALEKCWCFGEVMVALVGWRLHRSIDGCFGGVMVASLMCCGCSGGYKPNSLDDFQ
jgi:hypothetical protein